jgi:hypothetical protein
MVCFLFSQVKSCRDRPELVSLLDKYWPTGLQSEIRTFNTKKLLLLLVVNFAKP